MYFLYLYIYYNQSKATLSFDTSQDKLSTEFQAQRQNIKVRTFQPV